MSTSFNEEEEDLPVSNAQKSVQRNEVTLQRTLGCHDDKVYASVHPIAHLLLRYHRVSGYLPNVSDTTQSE